MPALNPAAKTTFAFAIYYAFLGSCILLLLSHSNQDFWRNLPLVGSLELDTHLTNFAISAIIFMASAAYAAARRLYSLEFVIAVILIITNLVIELGVTFLNVPDILDAVAGILGVIYAGLGLYLTDKFSVTRKQI